MQVAVGSIFRNSEQYISRYVQQFRYLQEMAPQHTFRPLIVEGDSTDETYELLRANFSDAVTKAEHGGPVFGSSGEPERFRQFSYCYERVLERLEPEDDAFIYVEADLIWEPATMLRLLAHLEKPEVDSVSPFCWFGGRHYDIWGLRGLDGDSLGFYPPHHISMLYETPNGLYPLSAAGSCLVMKGKMARDCHFDPADMAIVGFSWNATAKGYRLWLDPEARIHHPEAA